MEYIDQVADFIDRNTDYRQSWMDMGGDPFTGKSRYIPSEDNRKKNNSSASVHRPTKNENIQSSSNPHFPSNEFIYFGFSDQFSNMRKKLNEFNHQVDERMRMSDEEWILVSDKVIGRLEQESPVSNCIFSEEELNTMEKLLDWPTENIIPVLDICKYIIDRKKRLLIFQVRLMILSPSASSHFFLKKDNLGLEKVRKHLSSPNATIGVVILACRVICNMFSSRLVALLACE